MFRGCKQIYPRVVPFQSNVMSQHWKLWRNLYHALCRSFLVHIWGYHCQMSNCGERNFGSGLIRLLTDCHHGRLTCWTGWKECTGTRFVLTNIPTYLLIAISTPKWMVKAINKILRAFLWKGREELNGRSCLVSWAKVQWPIDLGGWVIRKLEVMGWALQMRWLWLAKTQPDHPWHRLEVPVHANVRALFVVSMVTQVEKGENTLFWMDRWLHGCSISDMAPLSWEGSSKNCLHSHGSGSLNWSELDSGRTGGTLGGSLLWILPTLTCYHRSPWGLWFLLH